MSEPKPRPKHRRPSAAELDERLIVPLDPEKFVEGVLQTGPHPEEPAPEYPADETDEG